MSTLNTARGKRTLPPVPAGFSVGGLAPPWGGGRSLLELLSRVSGTDLITALRRVTISESLGIRQFHAFGEFKYFPPRSLPYFDNFLAWRRGRAGWIGVVGQGGSEATSLLAENPLSGQKRDPEGPEGAPSVRAHSAPGALLFSLSLSRAPCWAQEIKNCPPSLLFS